MFPRDAAKEMCPAFVYMAIICQLKGTGLFFSSRIANLFFREKNTGYTFLHRNFACLRECYSVCKSLNAGHNCFPRFQNKIIAPWNEYGS